MCLGSRFSLSGANNELSTLYSKSLLHCSLVSLQPGCDETKRRRGGPVLSSLPPPPPPPPPPKKNHTTGVEEPSPPPSPLLPVCSWLSLHTKTITQQKRIGHLLISPSCNNPSYLHTFPRQFLTFLFRTFFFILYVKQIFVSSSAILQYGTKVLYLCAL